MYLLLPQFLNVQWCLWFFLSDLQLLFSKSNANVADENPSSSSKQVKGASDKFTSEPVNATGSQSETAQDLNAAKVAAMKAAELGGYLIQLRCCIQDVKYWQMLTRITNIVSDF